MESNTHPAVGQPAMDVVAPPPEQPVSKAAQVDPLEQLAAEDRAEQQAAAAKPSQPAPKPAKAKQPRAGVSLAITATVVIVLGLAALATYAYLQTTN